MARQEINLGTAPTGVGGDTTRSTGVKINSMTSEIYTLLGTKFDSASALLDPAGGGLLSRTTVSGLDICKFLNGLQLISGSLGASGNVPANTSTVVRYNLPVSVGPDLAKACVAGLAQPSNSYDHYGIVSGFADTATSVTLAIRNGGTAQSFNPRITIWSQWK
ncbi:hypothetical protein [Pseudomonas sp. R4-39-08]|uniref:hypothetical protein n=1 Tax=Pseudomonas sp. R4-39-08 TaxID=1173288 RepID=UPI000F580AC6|nr:hypothetical protein [Pseudomonas sp. R4-39-08]